MIGVIGAFGNRTVMLQTETVLWIEHTHHVIERASAKHGSTRLIAARGRAGRSLERRAALIREHTKSFGLKL